MPAARILESDFSSTGGYLAAARLLDGNPPSAIFAANDMMGIGVLRAAAERNIRVPSELSVIGFDDILMSRYVYPALTTVGQSILQLGRALLNCCCSVSLRQACQWANESSRRALSCGNRLRHWVAHLCSTAEPY